MKTLGYYNGKYGEIDEMMIPMNDRISWFGDGVYDALASRNGIMFDSRAHLDRFYNSARLLDIEIPYTKSELEDLLYEMIEKMDDPVLFVYYQATRGTADRQFTYQKAPANIWITLRPTYIGEGLEKIKLISVEDTRFLHCNIKTTNLIPAVMASQKAAEAGCDEVVFYRAGGRVTECAHNNIHMIKDGVFHTAPADNLILPGIGRKHLLLACEALGIPYSEEPYSMDELMDADEILISCSSCPCIPVGEIDGKAVGGKDPELLEKIRKYVVEELLRATEIGMPRERY